VELHDEMKSVIRCLEDSSRFLSDAEPHVELALSDPLHLRKYKIGENNRVACHGLLFVTFKSQQPLVAN
jgi:hypothetical protein